MKLIFTHLKPDIWQYKVASTLKAKGIKTASISLLSFDKKLFDNAFNEIICLELPNLKLKSIFLKFIKNPIQVIKFLAKIIKIKADAALIQGPPLYLASFFLWLFKGKFPRIFFSYDVNYALWKNIRKYSSKIEVWSEEYSFKNCDAVLNKNFVGELQLLPDSWGINKKPIIEFLGYPLEEWFIDYNPKNKLSYKDKEIHIIYPGNTPPENPDFIFQPYVRDVLKQKIHFHMYPNQMLPEKEIMNLIENKKELKPYLHIHPYASPEILSKEISKYDFGFFFGDYSGATRKEAMKYAFGTKFSSYLEASIPVIIQEGYDFINRDVSKNYLGIITKDAKNLGAKIKKFNYKKSVKNIQKFRQKNTVADNADRLIEFIKALNQKN